MASVGSLCEIGCSRSTWPVSFTGEDECEGVPQVDGDDGEWNDWLAEPDRCCLYRDDDDLDLVNEGNVGDGVSVA